MSGAAVSSCVRFLQTWAGAGAYSDRRRSLATELSVVMIVSSTLSTDDLSPRVGRFWRIHGVSMEHGVFISATMAIAISYAISGNEAVAG